MKFRHSVTYNTSTTVEIRVYTLNTGNVLLIPHCTKNSDNKLIKKKKDMDVYEHERLFKITHKIKQTIAWFVLLFYMTQSQ